MKKIDLLIVISSFIIAGIIFTVIPGAFVLGYLEIVLGAAYAIGKWVEVTRILAYDRGLYSAVIYLFKDYFLLTRSEKRSKIKEKSRREKNQMLVYKINVIEELKEAGYNATRIRDERPISQNAMQKIRKGEMIGIKTLEQLCKLLDMQPGNIIKYVED